MTLTATRPVKRGTKYDSTIRRARAQPPRAPHVYVIVAKGTPLAKIGMSTNVAARRRQLQTACPHELQVALVIPHGGRRLERLLHSMWLPTRARQNVKTEWFVLGKGGLDSIIRWCKSEGITTGYP